MQPGLGTDTYWAIEEPDLLRDLATQRTGLSTRDALDRLRVHGANEIEKAGIRSTARVLYDQVKSPLLLLLVFAAVAAVATSEWVDASMVLAIVATTVAVGASREVRAERASARLRERTHIMAAVLRDGDVSQIPAREVVPGDVVQLRAGSLVPADGVLLDATDFFVNEAVLTGETYPVEKRPGATPASANLARRRNCVFCGTNVRSGTATYVVVRTARNTQFGSIAHRLALRPPETEFDRGLRRFGYLLTTMMLALVLAVFGINTLLGRPAIETLLFSVALAVGLSPELLPAILSVNLARSAQSMMKHGVLVRRLTAVENLGSMDVLCTDKTGTLTEGVVRLEGAYDHDGEPCREIGRLARINATLQAGLANPLDEAIQQSNAAIAPITTGLEKVAEVPYDFLRKRLSVAVRDDDGPRLITKGAFEHVLSVCSRSADGEPLSPAERERALMHFRAWSQRGVRVLAVAWRKLREGELVDRNAEKDLVFAGFLTFVDRPKPGAREALALLAKLGVSVKLITGDTKLVAQHVARELGMGNRTLTGSEIEGLHDEALWHVAERTDLFVEVDPNEKERIILALKKMGHVVGFLGDGINDAPAMHAADTSLSVEGAVDVAREAADFVLLERNLDVIARGVREGRKTFANTMKYILTTTSANLGNVVSMAAASLFLPFLPLLSGQVLLNNFLSDVPAVGLADDDVDPELVEAPRRWDLSFVRRFMIEFGAVSSFFDFVTFGVLLYVFTASAQLFRTAWFVESLLTELVIALVVRTNRPFFRSRPGRLLLWSTAAVAALTLALPYLPLSHVFGFVPLPPSLMVLLLAIAALYVIATELLKIHFYRRPAGENGTAFSPSDARATI